MTPPIKPASGAIERYLRAKGFGAITLPPFGIFILPERMGEAGLIAHESVHWEQYQRMGAWKFYTTYLKNQAQYGYRDNPMEVEARDKSGIA